MTCNCGSQSTDHTVVRDKEVIAFYQKCTSCGRILWRFGENQLKEHEENKYK